MRCFCLSLISILLIIVVNNAASKYLLVQVEEEVTGRILASRQEGERCGQSTIEDCGFCDKGFICSTWSSPAIPEQCGICEPERRRSETFDLTLAKKEKCLERAMDCDLPWKHGLPCCEGLACKPFGEMGVGVCQKEDSEPDWPWSPGAM